jgi:hypothetical protein
LGANGQRANGENDVKLTIDRILTILLIPRGSFVLVTPSISVFPHILKRPATMTNVAPVASSVLAERMLGPSSEIKVPFTINDTGEIGDDCRYGVDVGEALEEHSFEEHTLRQTDGSK